MRPEWEKVLLVALLLFAQNVTAHTRSESYSNWTVSENRIVGIVTVPLREVMLLYEGGNASVPARDLLRQQLLENTSLFGAGESCISSGSSILQAASGFMRVELEFDCDERMPDTVRYRALFDQAPAHVHYARLHVGGVSTAEALLTDTADTWHFGGHATNDSWTFLSFAKIGTEHIAGGIDHIAFLIGLLLIAGSAGRAVVAVTGFTLGHSISLAAAVLGYVSADSQLVEAFIGFTVSLVAVEYFLLRHSRTNRFAMAAAVLSWATGLAALQLHFIDARALLAYLGFGVFALCYLLASRHPFANGKGNTTGLLLVATACFGLVHGFGFAGFLMDTGLLGTSLLMPLLGFNLGVELGQLILVAAALVAAALLRGRVPGIVPQLAAAGLCGIGIFWFVGRTLA